MRKITGAVIIIGALLAGCASPTAAPTPPAPTVTATQSATVTSTPTTTSTPEPTNAPTPAPTYTLSGTVFFDYNGNGLMDAGEPPIEGVPIRLAGLSTTSGPDGTYSIAGVPAGSQQVYVESPTQEPATAFRYTNTFLGWVDIPAYEIDFEMESFSVPAQHLADTEMQPINQPLEMALDGNQDLEIALTQGYLTLPFGESTDYLLWSYVDLDYTMGILLHESETLHVRNYANDRTYSVAADTDINSPNARSGTSDNHPGIDWYLKVGTPLLAMANGIVIQDPRQFHMVRIRYNIGSQVYVADCGHNLANLVYEGDYLHRGQIFALSGDWYHGRHGGTNPHVHFNHWVIPRKWNHDPPFYIFDSGEREMIPAPWGGLTETVDDPYRDVLSPNSVSYWTVDNNPQFPSEYTP